MTNQIWSNGTRAGLCGLFVWLAACGEQGARDADAGIADSAPATASPPGDSAAEVRAAVRDASGRDLGVLTLHDDGTGISITGRLQGLPPGMHGFHIHEAGRCEPPFESAGGHWNPTNRQHGRENPNGPHLGDLPNIPVAADSSAVLQVSVSGGTLRGADALLDGDGAAVVIHAGADDDRTDPSGNSGGRIACGVITAAPPG